MNIEEIAFKISNQHPDKILKIKLTGNIEHDTQNLFESILENKEYVNHVLLYKNKRYKIPHIENWVKQYKTTKIYYVPELYLIMKLDLETLQGSEIVLEFAYPNEADINNITSLILVKLNGDNNYLPINTFLELADTMYKSKKYKSEKGILRKTTVTTSTSEINIQRIEQRNKPDLISAIIISNRSDIII